MTKTLTVSLPDEVFERLERVRDEKGVTVSFQVRNALQTQAELDNASSRATDK